MRCRLLVANPHLNSDVQPPRSRLTSLPDELVSIVFDDIPRRKAPFINKRLLPFARANFYEDVCIKSQLQLSQFGNAIIGNPALGSYVRQLEITSFYYTSWVWLDGPPPPPLPTTYGLETFLKALQLLSNLKSLKLSYSSGNIIDAILATKSPWAPGLIELEIDAHSTTLDRFLRSSRFTTIARRASLKKLVLGAYTSTVADEDEPASLEEEQKEEPEERQTGTNPPFFPALEHLILKDEMSSQSVLFDLFPRLKLRRLTIHETSSREGSLGSTLAALSSSCTGLTHLEIIGARLHDSLPPPSRISFLPRLESLESLTLVSFEPNRPAEFYESLRHIPFKRLCVENYLGECPELELLALIERRTQHPTLEVVELNTFSLPSGTITVNYDGRLLDEMNFGLMVPGVNLTTGERTNELDWVKRLREKIRDEGIEAEGTTFNSIGYRERWVKMMATVKEVIKAEYPATEENRLLGFRIKMENPTHLKSLGPM
jgi:hypothetical protein